MRRSSLLRRAGKVRRAVPNDVQDAAPGAITGNGLALVMTFGLPALQLVADQGPVVAVDGPNVNLDGVLEAVGRALDDDRDGRVLVLYPAWSAEPALTLLRTVCSAVETDRVVTYGTSLPPLAGGVLGALASAVAPHLAGFGELVASLPVIERQLVVAARLGKVTGLHHPAPTFGQHLLSLWPPTAFVVTVAPTPSVRRLGSHSGVRLPLTRGAWPWAVAVSARAHDHGWLQKVLASFPMPPTVTTTEPTALGPTWWGTEKVVEVVVHPASAHGLAELVRSSLESPDACVWCGEIVVSERCPLCGMKRAIASAVRAEP